MLYGSTSKHWHCHRNRVVHDTPRSLIRVTCKPGPLTGKISRDWQFSPRPCTEFLLVSDMVGASSELEKNNKKPIQTPNNVIVAETLLYQDKSLAKTGIFGKCNIWCFSSALGGGSIKWWGVAEYHIFQGWAKMLGKERYYVRSSDGAHCRLSFT